MLATILGCETGKGRHLVKSMFLHQLPQWTEMIPAGIHSKRLKNICLHIIPALECWKCGIYNPIPVGGVLQVGSVNRHYFLGTSGQSGFWQYYPTHYLFSEHIYQL